MRKRLILIIILIAMISVFTLNSGHTDKWIVENDGVIEWRTDSVEKMNLV